MAQEREDRGRDCPSPAPHMQRSGEPMRRERPPCSVVGTGAQGTGLNDLYSTKVYYVECIVVAPCSKAFSVLRVRWAIPLPEEKILRIWTGH